MSAENALWSLLHIESKSQIDSLSFQQTKLLVSAFDQTEYLKWAVWHEGLADWHLLDELVSALGLKPRQKIAPPQDLNKPPAFTGLAYAVHTNPAVPVAPEAAETLTRSDAMLNPDGRLSRRFPKKYKVYVGTRGKMHESMTVDLSLTGLQIVDSIPPGNDGNLEVALVNSKGENLSLICALVQDERRTRLKIVRAGKLDLLQQWLQNSAD